jgi:cysteinyl-tRNA synthetase
MIIYNSLTGKKEKIPKYKNKKVKLFVCGPTVYDYPHIGNFRSFLFFDSFVKYLRSEGYKVFYLQNITDIDDKIINRAKEEKTSWQKVAQKFEKIYHQNEKQFGITAVNKYAKASKHIKEIVKQVQILIKKGFAYEIKGDGIYFDISKFKDYGKLSKRTYLKAEDAISRIDENPNKKNKGDFALWKFYKEGEPFWDTPLGKGRPGWHIEDTAISVKYFGPQYDLHGGGVDLKFPHHEAEIAQAEAAYGKIPFVKIWIHTGHLLVNGEKMSKSLGNFITAQDFAKENDPQILRLIVLLHSFSSPINFTKDLLLQTTHTFKGIKIFLLKLKFISDKKIKNKKNNIDIKNKLKELDKKTRIALNNNFNSPLALSYIFSFIKEMEKEIWNISSFKAQYTLNYLLKFFGKIGLNFDIKNYKIPPKITTLAKEREVLRNNKRFSEADNLRNKIKELGYIIEDTPLGPFIYKEN